MPANAIIRVVFGDITFPLQKEEWRVGERERAKTANAGGMLKEEMSCLTYLRMMHKSFKSISVLLKAWLKARHRVEVSWLGPFDGPMGLILLVDRHHHYGGLLKGFGQVE